MAGPVDRMFRAKSSRERCKRGGPSNRLRAARPQFADEGSDAIHKRIAGWRRRLGGVRSGGRGQWRGSDGGDCLAFDAAVEDERGAHANAANKHNHFRIEFWLGFGVNVVDQGRHENLVDRLFLDAGFFGGGGGSAGLWFDRFVANFFGGSEPADFGRWRRSGFGNLGLTRAVAGASAEAIELAVEYQNIASLRNEDALPRELLLEADGTTIGTNAHCARVVETDQNILWPAADGDGLNLELGRIDGQGGLALDVHMNRAAIQSYGERTTGFQDRKMRGAAYGDLAAFDKVDAGGAGFDVHIAAAAENGFYLAVDGFDAHRAGDGDGLAVYNSYGV